MMRFGSKSLLLAVCCLSGTALGRAPLIDQPTPPPSAADGICYPNTGGWGYYPARWRTWPGMQLEPTPSKSPTEAGRVSPELGPSETPPADLEDAAAPPSSARPREKDDESAAPSETPPATPPGGETSLPDVPLPDAESASPLGPATYHDPPPVLPRSLSANSHPFGRTRANVAPVSRPATSRVSTNDPPPTPPWAQSASL
jgi:hypothetical protein